MQRRHTTSCALIVAPLFLATCFATPGTRHTHPGGGAPHGHAHLARHHHGHGHGHAHVHRHAGAAVRESIVHVHVSVFFFDFTFPSPGSDRPEDPDRGVRLPPSVIAVMVSPVARDLTDATGGSLFKPMLSSPGACSGPSVQSHPAESMRGRAVRVLLCDTARRERSGVQLI